MSADSVQTDPQALFRYSDAASLPFQLSRTCIACAAAKVKCRRTGDSSTCDRCHRLKKECWYRPALRRDNGTKRDHRMDALESKINQLLNAQSPSAGASSAPVSPGQPRYPSSTSFNNQLSASTPPKATYFGSQTGDTPEASLHALPSIHYRDVITDGIITMEAATTFFDTFKKSMSRNFPFVIIPPETGSEDLRQKKPFLFLAILAVASYQNMTLQKRLGDAVKHAVATRMLLSGDTSFELLQGLLIYLAWGQYHTRPRRYNQFLQLAISIVIELRLQRPPKKQDWKNLVLIKSGTPGEMDAPTELSWDRDRRRAVAGCYYLSSSIAAILQKMPTFPYSVYVEEYCRSLQDDPEYPSDRLLIYIIQLQHINEKIDRLAIQHAPDPNNPDSSAQLYVTAMKSELELFKERLQFPMGESHLLVIQFHTVELYLYQICLHQQYNEFQKASQISWAPWRLEALCDGLIAAKSLLDFYFALPLSSVPHLNNTQSVQIGFATMIATKLAAASMDESVFRETSPLRESLNMEDLLGRIVGRLDFLSSRTADDSGDADAFSRCAKRVRFLHRWFQSQIPANSDPRSTRSPQETREETQDEPMDTNVIQQVYLPESIPPRHLLDNWTAFSNSHQMVNGIYDLPWTIDFANGGWDPTMGNSV